MGARGGRWERDARAPPGTDLLVPGPPLPGSRSRPTARVPQAAAVGELVGREGSGGAGTKELSAGSRAVRAAHLAPGSRHLLRAHRLSGQGCGLGER